MFLGAGSGVGSEQSGVQEALAGTPAGASSSPRAPRPARGSGSLAPTPRFVLRSALSRSNGRYCDSFTKSPSTMVLGGRGGRQDPGATPEGEWPGVPGHRHPFRPVPSSLSRTGVVGLGALTSLKLLRAPRLGRTRRHHPREARGVSPAWRAARGGLPDPAPGPQAHMAVRGLARLHPPAAPRGLRSHSWAHPA